MIVEENPDILIIITSDFHIERAQILYKRYIAYPKVVFIPAISSLSKAELVPLIEHESCAVKRLKEEEV
ncbi:hypothetical protein [Sphingobacterium sp. E70]|uniref:hypothetical protein n=1 Tax=Sphingobacterium sp. E70 TaxID=2853439 RepID=UPI00359C310C